MWSRSHARFRDGNAVDFAAAARRFAEQAEMSRNAGVMNAHTSAFLALEVLTLWEEALQAEIDRMLAEYDAEWGHLGPPHVRQPPRPATYD
jgi:hypothetical protein